MTILKDLVADKHSKAERHPFIKKLFTGKLSIEEYVEFLLNQEVCYSALENRLNLNGLLDGIEDIARAERIRKDIRWYLDNYGLDTTSFKLHVSSHDYAQLVNVLDYDGLMAHLYVRHFGDMYGGSMIAKKLTGPGHMYEFEDKAYLIDTVSKKLTKEMSPQANLCFDFAIKLFDEVNNP